MGIALAANDALAQTCVGTSDIVCTYSGASGAIGNPPSGPVSGSTNLTNILTAAGTANAILTFAGEFGNAAVTNDGVVSGNVLARAGIFSGDGDAATATITNHGTVTGLINSRTEYAGDATVYNDGHAAALTALVNGTAFGAPRIFNSGYATTILIQGSSSLFGGAYISNSGITTGLIASIHYGGSSTVINSGSANAIRNESVGSAARTTNTGTVTTEIITVSDDIYGAFAGAAAETINSGSVQDITTTVGRAGSATTTNAATGIARNILTHTGGINDAVTTNYGQAESLTSDTNDGAAIIRNYGIAGPVTGSSDSGPVFVSNSGRLGQGVTATSHMGQVAIANSGSINGAVAANADAGPASVVNTGSIHGVVTVTSAYNGSAGPGSFLTNAGLIDGTGYYAAIDVTSYAPDHDRMTLNLLPGSRVIGRILLTGDASNPVSVGTTINIQNGHSASSILTFGDSTGLSSGLTDTASHVYVSGAYYVVSGNSVAVVDPSSFGIADRNIVDITHAIGGLATARLANAVPANTDGPALGFAPSGNVARDMINDAFATIPGLAYAGQDRVLSGNPNFTAPDGTSVWAQGFSGRRVAPEDGLMLRSINSFYGGAIGIDKIVQPKLRLGAFVGGGNLQSDLAADSGRTTSDLGFAGVYGRYALTGAFIDFSLLGGGSGNAAIRRVDNNLAANGVEYARANYVGWFVSPELAYGFDRSIGTNLTLTPTIRLRYLAAGFDGYQESSSAANLSVASRTSHYFEQRGGLTLTRSFTGIAQGVLNVTGSAGVVGLQRAGDSNVNAVLLGQNLAFAAPGGGNVMGYFVGAGIDWRHASGVSLFAATEYNELSDASRTITGRGGIKIAF